MPNPNLYELIVQAQAVDAQGIWASLLGPIATLTLAAVSWISVMVFKMRDGFMRIPDILKKLEEHDTQLDELNKHKNKIELLAKVYESELAMFDGPERRRMGVVIQQMINESKSE